MPVLLFLRKLGRKLSLAIHSTTASTSGGRRLDFSTLTLTGALAVLFIGGAVWWLRIGIQHGTAGMRQASTRPVYNQVPADYGSQQYQSKNGEVLKVDISSSASETNSSRTEVNVNGQHVSLQQNSAFSKTFVTP